MSNFSSDSTLNTYLRMRITYTYEELQKFVVFIPEAQLPIDEITIILKLFQKKLYAEGIEALFTWLNRIRRGGFYNNPYIQSILLLFSRDAEILKELEKKELMHVLHADTTPEGLAAQIECLGLKAKTKQFSKTLNHSWNIIHLLLKNSNPILL